MEFAAVVTVIGNIEHRPLCTLSNQEVFQKFQKFIPENFRIYADYTWNLAIPLVYNSPEYTELFNLLNSYNIEPSVRLRSFYKKSELAKAEYFHLLPYYPLELEGTSSADYGTKHQDSCQDKFCRMCGELVGDVYVDRKFMKNKKFGTLYPDLFVSEEIQNVIEEAELTGVKFGGLVKDYKGREMKDKYYVMHITSILPPLSQSTWIEESSTCSFGHTTRYLRSDLMYEREKLANAQDFNLTCEHLNNDFLQEIVVSTKVKKVLSKYRLMFREPICIL